jgi:hypothetical protein
MLERQRRFHGGASAWWRWLAFSVGGLTFVTGVARVDGWSLEQILTAALWVALSLGVFTNGLVQSARYEKEIAEIDHLQLEES